MEAATKPLAGKTALVTGASRGIGRSIAIALGRAGALVCIHYASARDAAEAVATIIRQEGGDAFCVAADLGSAAGVAALQSGFTAGLKVIGKTGFDILVNNAGIGTMGTIAETDEATYDRMMDVNVKGMFLLTQAMLPQLRDGGRIVNLSSMVTAVAYPSCIAYAMAKASVNSFTRSLAAELGARNITVNAVAPGATDTDFIASFRDNTAFMDAMRGLTALGRVGGPDDIAGVVLFLASQPGGWITGQVIQASGGMHL